MLALSSTEYSKLSAQVCFCLSEAKNTVILTLKNTVGDNIDQLVEKQCGNLSDIKIADLLKTKWDKENIRYAEIGRPLNEYLEEEFIHLKKKRGKCYIDAGGDDSLERITTEVKAYIQQHIESENNLSNKISDIAVTESELAEIKEGKDIGELKLLRDLWTENLAMY